MPGPSTGPPRPYGTAGGGRSPRQLFCSVRDNSLKRNPAASMRSSFSLCVRPVSAVLPAGGQPNSATGEHTPPACRFRRPAEILPTPELPERSASRRAGHAGRVCSPELNRSVGARWNERPTFCASLRLFVANPCNPCNPWSSLSAFAFSELPGEPPDGTRGPRVVPGMLHSQHFFDAILCESAHDPAIFLMKGQRLTVGVFAMMRFAGDQGQFLARPAAVPCPATKSCRVS